MEYILAKELELERKLKEVEDRKKALAESRGLVNLAEIKTPEDLSHVAQERKMKAYDRNSKLLQDLDIEIGRLHTKRLCPISERLDMQKAIFFRDFHHHHHSSHSQHSHH